MANYHLCTQASLDNPANIPVVLSSTCLLYQTRLGGFQEELSLPLGMVVNAVFKNQCWLYVQTPHGEEGYVRYTSCLPLGILPPRTPAPCWETHTDIFPMPLGQCSVGCNWENKLRWVRTNDGVRCRECLVGGWETSERQRKTKGNKPFDSREQQIFNRGERRDQNAKQGEKIVKKPAQ